MVLIVCGIAVTMILSLRVLDPLVIGLNTISLLPQDSSRPYQDYRQRIKSRCRCRRSSRFSYFLDPRRSRIIVDIHGYEFERILMASARETAGTRYRSLS